MKYNKRKIVFIEVGLLKVFVFRSCQSVGLYAVSQVLG